MAMADFRKLMQTAYLQGRTISNLEKLRSARIWEMRTKSIRNELELGSGEMMADAYDRISAAIEMRYEEFDSNPRTEMIVAVRWAGTRPPKTYKVTGTRHAYYLIRKLAVDERFRGAIVHDWLTTQDGKRIPNEIQLFEQDVYEDAYGKFRSLLNRNNTNYDLSRSAK